MAEKLMRWITKGEDTVEFLHQLRIKIRSSLYRFLKGAAYWTVIVVIGLFLTGGIMHKAGMPVFDPIVIQAQDTDAGPPEGSATALALDKAGSNASTWVGSFVGSIIYGVGIATLGPIAAILAFLFDVIIGYPYDTAYWSVQADTGGFVNVSSVKIGWKLVRDVCNIFFSLILIIIALATVLRIEAYAWKQSLSKFIIAVILINFSKSIAGLFTDVATVITATFAGSFASSFATPGIPGISVAKGLFAGFGLQDLLSYNLAYNSTAADPIANGAGLLMAYIVALVVVFIFCMFMLYYMVVLTFRIIMLWFLIVMSPLAFLANILPVTKKYATQWWSMFGRWVMTAPLIAFFFWLTLTMLYSTGNPNEQVVSGSGAANPGVVSGITSGALNEKAKGLQDIGPVKATTPSAIGSVLIASVMLMASAKLVKSLASEGGNMLGKVESAAPKIIKGGMEKTGRFIMGRASSFSSFALAKDKDGKERPWSETKDKDGNVVQGQSWWNKGFYGFGKTVEFLGATAGQPFTLTEKYLEQRKKVKESQKNKRERGRAKILEEHAQTDVLYDKDGKKLSFGRNLLGAIRMLAGAVGAAGTDVGEHYQANVLSLKGVASAIELWGADKKFEGYREARTKLGVIRTNKEDEDNRLTEDEAKEAKRDLASASEAVEKYDDLSSKLISGALCDINLKVPEMHLIFTGHLDELKRQKTDLLNRGYLESAPKMQALNQQINDLTKDLEKEDSITMQDIEGRYAGSGDTAAQQELVEGVRQQVVGVAESKKKTFQDELGKLRKRMEDTGYVIDGANTVTTTGTNFADETKRADLGKKLADAEKTFERLSQETAALGPGENIASRVAYAQALHEAEGKIRGLNINDLFTYLERAIKNKDAMMVDAISDAIAGQGYLQDMLKRYADGQSGADGLHDFTNNVLVKKLKMNEQAARRKANNLGATAADKVQDYSVFGLYNYDPRTGYDLHDADGKKSEGKRVQMILKYLSTQPKSTLSRLKWTTYLSEDTKGSLSVSDLGKGIINFAGEDFENERIWNNMPSKSKDYMSLPQVTRGLRSAGAPTSFVGKLEGWHRRRPFDPSNPIDQSPSRLISRLAK